MSRQPAWSVRFQPAWLAGPRQAGLRQPLAFAGAVVLGTWSLAAACAPLLSPFDPLAQASPLLMPPSGQHLFGTDELGRDVLSRVIWGARVSLPLAPLSVAIVIAVGGTLGGLAGYCGGWVDGLV